MDLEQVCYMIETRQKAAERSGNTTELSFLYEIAKIVEEKRQAEKNKGAQ